jgi:hypothetical protein
MIGVAIPITIGSVGVLFVAPSGSSMNPGTMAGKVIHLLYFSAMFHLVSGLLIFKRARLTILFLGLAMLMMTSLVALDASMRVSNVWL